MIKFFKKYHKWLGVIFLLFFLLFSLSGIVLNHRELFAGIDISRNLLPKEYLYNNWNNAAVKNTEKISKDSILIYGNIGIYLTDSNAVNFVDFNKGFPKGVDNHKVCKVFKTKKGGLFAGTFFGLYKYDILKKTWIRIELPTYEKRITDITEKNDTLFVMTRSVLLKTVDYQKYETIILPKPEHYDNKASLFKTLWVIHSGEIYGTIGKLIVDLVGLIFIFLTITGFILFINKYRIKCKHKKNKETAKIIKTNRWNLKWHNKIGWITAVILLITTITGIFLRPPLLITIAESKVSKLPFTKLDSTNPWFDKLRRIIYDEQNNKFIIATIDGIYYCDSKFKNNLKKFESQPAISVMGINVLKKTKTNTLLVGSFAGLFEWNTKTGELIDYIEKKKYIKPTSRNTDTYNDITGYSSDLKNTEFFFDFKLGAIEIGNGNKIKMPDEITKQKISLWNVALEFHTARIYSVFIGGLYILVIPLLGLISLFIIISGFVVWYKST